jgi:hypothetical protein
MDIDEAHITPTRGASGPAFGFDRVMGLTKIVGCYAVSRAVNHA